MTLTLRSSSGNFHENERLTRARVNNPTTFNRFLSFNDNKSATAENRRRLLHSTPNLIELLEEDEDDFDDPQALCHECSTCSKVFASEYGLNYHTTMYHPNQSVLCSLCHITFRSHRSLKTHLQRRHTRHQTIRNNGKSNSIHPLPNYQYLSPYLMLAFSSQQFPSMAKKACEEKRLPLGSFSSQLYRCSSCQISFPCSRTLTKHQLEEHEHYEYNLCRTVLHDIIIQIEYPSSRTVENCHDDEFEAMALILAKQASHFGLKTKSLAEKSRLMKIKDRRLISPICQHEERTCANLCLQYLSSYDKLMQNYSYSIPIVPKGNPFAQGSIVSNIPLTIALSLTPSTAMDSNTTQETNNNNNTTTRAKRRTLKHVDGATSPQLKRKNPNSNGTNTNNGKTNRSNGIKNETKPVLLEAPASAPPIVKKPLPKDIVRSSSKRTLSPSVTVQTEPSPSKRRRARSEKNQITSSSSSPVATVIKIVDDNDDDDDDDDDDDVEQENDDDGDIIPIDVETSKQIGPSKKRQASSGSVEYVQSLDDDQQPASSLNNIENLNSKSKNSDDDILICPSTQSKSKVIPAETKTSSKASINGNNKSKSTSQRLINSDDNVRVRCKICGEILEGRSRFSQHVISQHGHLLKKNMTESKQQQSQQPQQTAFVR